MAGAGWGVWAGACLRFVGLGVQAIAASWGIVLSDGQCYFVSYPWFALSAGSCIAVVVVALNFLGDGLRDTFDPKALQRGAM